MAGTRFKTHWRTLGATFGGARTRLARRRNAAAAGVGLRGAPPGAEQRGNSKGGSKKKRWRKMDKLSVLGLISLGTVKAVVRVACERDRGEHATQHTFRLSTRTAVNSGVAAWLGLRCSAPSQTRGRTQVICSETVPLEFIGASFPQLHSQQATARRKTQRSPHSLATHTHTQRARAHSVLEFLQRVCCWLTFITTVGATYIGLVITCSLC